MQSNKILLKTKFKQNKGTSDYSNKNYVKISVTIDTNHNKLDTDQLIKDFCNIQVRDFEKDE